MTAALFAVCAFGSVPAVAQVSGLGSEITVPPLPIDGGTEGSTPAPSTTTTTAPAPTPTTAPAPAGAPAPTTAPAPEGTTTPKPAGATETARRATPKAPRRASTPGRAAGDVVVEVAPAVAEDKPAIARLRQVSLPAARQFGFPLALAGLVLAFLAVQGRLDARDPKLASAPLSIDDDLLPFA